VDDDKLRDLTDKAIAEAEKDSGGAEEDTQQEGDDDNQGEEDGGGEEKPGAGAEPEDDEAFLESQKGKSIPYPAFQKKYAKWKERHSAAEQKAAQAEAKLAEMVKKGELSNEDRVKFQRAMAVFEHYDRAARQKPWLAQVLMSLGQGKEPDWQAIQQALADHLKATPNMDPRIVQQLEETQARVREMETQALTKEIEAHMSRENEEITKILGEDGQDLREMLDEMAEKLVPENGTLQDLPNRVAMAKRIKAWADTQVQRTLKKQIPSKPRTDLNAGNGNAAPAKTKSTGPLPEAGTEEWMAEVLRRGGLSE
jgi:hypothetical protein